jgi:hypothetical protein
MWKLFLALSLTAFLSTVGAAPKTAANTATPEPLQFKYEPSLQRLDLRVATLMGEEKQKTLRQMAEASVLSDYCAAVDLDRDAFKKAFEALAISNPPRKLADQREFENKLMTYFGVYVGLLVAEGTDRKPEVCALAQQLKEDQKPVSRFWLKTSAVQPPAAK